MEHGPSTELFIRRLIIVKTQVFGKIEKELSKEDREKLVMLRKLSETHSKKNRKRYLIILLAEFPSGYTHQEFSENFPAGDCKKFPNTPDKLLKNWLDYL